MSPRPPEPDWKWGTPEGSREFDRLVDRTMTFREKLEWLEATETLALRLQASREKSKPPKGSQKGSEQPKGSGL